MRLNRQLAARRVSRILFGILSFTLLFQLTACESTPDAADNDTTNTFVRIVSVASQPNEFTPGDEGTDLLSDVCFADEDHPPCTVFNDNIVVTFEALPKDQQVLSSFMNDIIFERYRVTYTRSDGLNVPGVDVPHSFDGVSSFMVPSDGSEVTRGFIVVRHQAKRETPLRELTFGGGGILSVLAQVDFFGRDAAGRAVQVTAHLNITFADFANE